MPDPLAPDAIWSHGAAEVAVHEHALVTATEPVVPAAGAVACVGAMVTVQAGAGCDTRNCADPMRRIPIRVCAVVLAEAAKVTRPFPVPLAAEVIEIHVASETTVQLHVV